MTQDYDAVFGADETVINKLILATFDALKPTKILHQTIPVNQIDIATVEIDVNAAPIVKLSVSGIPLLLCSISILKQHTSIGSSPLDSSVDYRLP
jgi:hypothetical protein